MKVVHVELGRHLYGGARQVAYLLNDLGHQSDDQVLVCCHDAEIASAIRSSAVQVRRLKFRGDLDLWFYRELRALIREADADIVHVHSRRGDQLSLLAARHERRRRVHSRRVDNPPGWFDLRYKFPLCHRIVTISEGIRTVLRVAGVPEERLRCVLSAVDTDRYRPANATAEFRRAFGLGPKDRVVAMVAQLIPRKGHQVLFDALPAVRQRHPDVRVLIFGRGPMESELKAQVAAQGLSEHVRFQGFRTDMEVILPQVEVVVHPAWMEGLGVSLLEAAASGVPIIASRAGGMPEIVVDGHNGFLVTPGDAAAVGAALNRLLEDTALRQAQGRAARQRVLEHFAIRAMVDGNQQVYRELMEAEQAESGRAQTP